MDKTVAGLLGAFGALVASTPGHASPQPPSPATVLEARSYAELLRPIPNALETLRMLDADGPDAQIEQVQLGPIVRDLVRPHHHHRHYRRRYYHHHHHRHHHGYNGVIRR